MKKIAIVSFLSLVALGCGDDSPQVKTNNQSNQNNQQNNNTSSNNTSSNNTSSNNTSSNNTSSNNTSSNNTSNNTSNNNTISNNVSGSVTFVAPAVEVTYTNGTLDIEIAVEGQASDVELMLGDTDTLHDFANTSFAWNTTELPEGSYELKLRYDLVGNVYWSADERTVIVDRTAPAIHASTPENGATEVPSQYDLQVEMDEPLDPTTVNVENVLVEFSDNQTIPYTVTLADDGMTIHIDYDPSALTAPYTATVTMNGVADWAGNQARGRVTFDVPMWTGGVIAPPLVDHFYIANGANEYVFGIRKGSPSDTLYVAKNEGSDPWTMKINLNVGFTYSASFHRHNDRVFIAVLRRTTANGLTIKGVQLYTFDLTNDTITAKGESGLGVNVPGGKVAVFARVAFNQDRGIIAVVNDSRLRVLEFQDAGLTINQPNVFPSTDYDNVREESLAVAIHGFGTPEVIFARCNVATSPCVRTFVERVHRNANNVWTAVGTTSTPAHASASQCDEFENFEAVWKQTLPVLLMAFHAPCSAPIPTLRNVEGTAAGWDSFYSNIFDSMPNPDMARYRTHLALGANDQVYALIASNSRMHLVTYGASGVTWSAPVAPDYSLSAVLILQQFRQTRLFMDATHRPIVLFRYGNNTHLQRLN